MTTKTKTSNITEAQFLEGMRKSCKLAAQILREAGTLVKPGIKTIDINEFVHEKTLAAGAYPAPLNYPLSLTNPRNPKIGKGGFPASVCTSVNEVVCHGIPGDYVLKEGDIVNIDVTTILDGYFGDTSATFMVGQVAPEIKKLVEVTYKCLELGIAAVVPGGRTIDIAKAITNYAEPLGYSVVRDYTGHGVGRIFHTKPTISHYPSPETDAPILPGMFFTVEPMINLGTYHTVLDEKDHWTVRTRDGKPSAQFEHTLYVGPMGVEVLTVA
jgi:methionyl aminopeptidase